MYWYLSFLRPPPVSAPLGEPVVITPQVANDLRTELREAPTEVHYAWHRLHPPSAPLPAAPLTTFAPPASTYRPLPVALPRAARAGELWRLGLLAPPAPGPAALPLERLLADPGVLGVWSEGIQLTPAASPAAAPPRGKPAPAKGGKGGKGPKAKEAPKQSRITRSWPTRDGALKVVEQTSFDLDKKVWDSGLALAAWLGRYVGQQQQREHPHAAAREVLRRAPRATVLELGSGTGLVGIALQPLAPHARITATDLDSAMEIMRENIDLNGVDVAAAVLDWDAPLPAWVAADWPSLVLAADVTYNTASFPALVGTLERLLKPPPPAGAHAGPAGPAPLLLLAYKQRDEAERELWAMLAARGIRTVLVDAVQGAEKTGETEIWVAGVDLPDA